MKFPIALVHAQKICIALTELIMSGICVRFGVVYGVLYLLLFSSGACVRFSVCYMRCCICCCIAQVHV